MLENARSVGVDKTRPNGRLGASKEVVPVRDGRPKKCVCPEAKRGLYAARDEVLFIPEWGPLKGTRVRGFDRGSHVVEKICRWFSKGKSLRS